MGGSSRLRATIGVLATAAASLALAGPALASDNVIEVQDACDPGTFPNGPDNMPLCVRADGNSGRRVTFDELLGRLAKDREHGAWSFKPDEMTIKAGESVTAKMGRGGEAHTFTKVDAFGKGCVPELNKLVFPAADPSPAPICFTAAFGDSVVTGAGHFPENRTVTYDNLSVGQQKFQCLIHPWMKTTITVE